jgi:hypothetical protein
MALVTWIGGALGQAQITSWTFSGVWEADDVVNVRVNGKTQQVTGGSTVITEVIDNVVTELNLLTDPDFAAITWSRDTNDLVATADVEGIPFTAVVGTEEADGSPADLQLVGSATTVAAVSGPNHWDNPDNWDTGSVPVTSDTAVFRDSSVDCLYGLDQSASGVTLDGLIIEASYTGKLGLPRVNSDGTVNATADRYLKIQVLVVEIGDGVGSGSGRINIDSLTTAGTTTVYSSGVGEINGESAVKLLCDSFSRSVVVLGGQVGICEEREDSGEISALDIGTSASGIQALRVIVGDSVTVPAINIYAGTLYVASNLTTINQWGGEVYAEGNMNITTATLYGGTMYYSSSSANTITTLVVYGGAEINFAQLEPRDCTVTNAAVYGAADNTVGFIDDRFGVVTWTNPIQLRGLKLSTPVRTPANVGITYGAL